MSSSGLEEVCDMLKHKKEGFFKSYTQKIGQVVTIIRRGRHKRCSIDSEDQQLLRYHDEGKRTVENGPGDDTESTEGKETRRVQEIDTGVFRRKRVKSCEN